MAGQCWNLQQQLNQHYHKSDSNNSISYISQLRKNGSQSKYYCYSNDIQTRLIDAVSRSMRQREFLCEYFFCSQSMKYSQWSSSQIMACQEDLHFSALQYFFPLMFLKCAIWVGGIHSWSSIKTFWSCKKVWNFAQTLFLLTVSPVCATREQRALPMRFLKYKIDICFIMKNLKLSRTGIHLFIKMSLPW